MITVIYHSADFDGIFCREIAKKFLPEAKLIGWDFGDAPLTKELFENGGTVYVLDLPADRVFGFDWHGPDDENSRAIVMAFGFNGLVWIDHHKSSIDAAPKEIVGYRIDGVAACRLAWQWFKHWVPDLNNGTGGTNTFWERPDKQDFIDRKVNEPHAVRLAGEYDIWDKRDPDAELFQHGLRSQELNENHWVDLLAFPYNGNGLVGSLLAQGKAIQYARAEEYKAVIQSQGFDVQFEGLTVLACNSHELDIRSHLFEAGIKPNHDALLGFTWSGKQWRVSMYHAPGKESHDLSVIAKKYGGGGHRGACGFVANQLPFNLK